LKEGKDKKAEALKADRQGREAEFLHSLRHNDDLKTTFLIIMSAGADSGKE
jgi:hypothetical protein